MSELEQRLQPAFGYLKLGMHQDAWDELDALPPGMRAMDEVMEIRIEIYRELGKWESARVLAESLAKRSPENAAWWIEWAYAARRECSVEAGRSVLLEAFKIHPGVALIAYNLGCYACVLGEVEVACNLLTHAFGIDSSLKRVALDDPDLDRIYGANLPEPPPFPIP